MAITDNLAGYWNLSEASGTRADSSGNGETLTDVNTVTGTTGPGSHNASLFTAANVEALTHANDANLNVFGSDFTVALWLKLTSLVDFQGFAMHGTSTGPSRAWALYQQGAPDNTVAFISYQTNGSTISGAITSVTFGALSTATWYFIVASRVTATGAMALSINAGGEDTTTSTTFCNTTQTFGFGWRDSIGGSSFNGAIAMAGLWKRVLTSTERTFLYNSGSGLSYAEMIAAAENVYRAQLGVTLQAMNRGATF